MYVAHFSYAKTNTNFHTYNELGDHSSLYIYIFLATKKKKGLSLKKTKYAEENLLGPQRQLIPPLLVLSKSNKLKANKISLPQTATVSPLLDPSPKFVV